MSDEADTLRLPLLTFCYNWAKWKDFIDEAYDVFKTDFIENRPTYMGMKVLISNTLEEGKSTTFWHIVTRDGTEVDRSANVLRAERIGWALALVEQHSRNEITVFRHTDKDKKLKHYFWHKEEKHVVVLTQKDQVNQASRLYLTTSFVVDKTWKMRELENKFKSGEID